MTEGGDEEMSSMSKMKRTLSLANLYQPFMNTTSVSLCSFQMDTAVRYLPRISTTNMYTFDRFQETQSEIEIHKSMSAKSRKLNLNHSMCLNYNVSYSEPNITDQPRASNRNCCCASSDSSKNVLSSGSRNKFTYLYRAMKKQARATTYEIDDNSTTFRGTKENGTALHKNKIKQTQTNSSEKAKSNRMIVKHSKLESIKDSRDARSCKNALSLKYYHLLEPETSSNDDKSGLACDAIKGINDHNRKLTDSNEDIDNIASIGEIEARTVESRIVTPSVIEDVDSSSTDDGISESKCSASLLSEEESVWIKRSSFANGQVMENRDLTDREITLRRPMEASIVVSRPPRILMLLVVLGALLNPILAPAGLYLLIKSKRARSKRRYYSAEQYVYKAGGITIIGMFLTITSIVLLTLLPRNEVNMGKITETYTTTSYNSNNNAANIQFAGERIRNILSQSNPYTRSRKRTTYRGAKRTTSPKQLYTKTRHSSHRFGNIVIENHQREQNIVPTKAVATTKAEHIKDFLRDDVAQKPIHLTFRNRTVSVYFDPENNRTIVVHIPEFLQ